MFLPLSSFVELAFNSAATPWQSHKTEPLTITGAGVYRSDAPPNQSVSEKNCMHACMFQAIKFTLSLADPPSSRNENAWMRGQTAKTWGLEGHCCLTSYVSRGSKPPPPAGGLVERCGLPQRDLGQKIFIWFFYLNITSERPNKSFWHSCSISKCCYLRAGKKCEISTMQWKGVWNARVTCEMH